MKRSNNFQSPYPDYFNPYNPDNYRQHTESPLKIPRFDYTSALASVSRSMTPAFNFNDFSNSMYNNAAAATAFAAAAAATASAFNAATATTTTTTQTQQLQPPNTVSSSPSSMYSSSPPSCSSNQSTTEASIQCEMGIECLRYLQQTASSQQQQQQPRQQQSCLKNSEPTTNPKKTSSTTSRSLSNEENDLSNYFTADVLNSLLQSAPTVVVGPRPTANGKAVAVAGNIRVVNWTNAETLCFLDLCIKHNIPKQMQEPGYRFGKVFQKISEKMSDSGFYRTTTQLKDKYKMLKTRYNKGDMNGLERDCIRCIKKLFDEMDNK